jgi:DHA2 family multidrug resistance protein
LFAASVWIGTMALLPIFLQTLLGIPVLTSGILMAPRGIGTLLVMLSTPYLAARMDARWLLLAGILLTSVSMAEMAHFTLEVDTGTIISTGFVQGLGLGFTMVPVSILLFSTLDRRYRTEGSAIYNLLRNLGGSLFISLLTTLLAQNTQVYHAQLGEALTPFRDALQQPWLPQIWDWTTATGAMILDGEVMRQASSMAYFSDFALMQWLVLLTIPLLLLFRQAPVVTTKRDDEEPLAALE